MLLVYIYKYIIHSNLFLLFIWLRSRSPRSLLHLNNNKKRFSLYLFSSFFFFFFNSSIRRRNSIWKHRCWQNEHRKTSLKKFLRRMYSAAALMMQKFPKESDKRHSTFWIRVILTYRSNFLLLQTIFQFSDILRRYIIKRNQFMTPNATLELEMIFKQMKRKYESWFLLHWSQNNSLSHKSFEKAWIISHETKKWQIIVQVFCHWIYFTTKSITVLN